jgi:aerobic carbon-monoxide dehydrogenase medium subunit
VKPPPFEYVAVHSVDEALAELARHGDDAKLLAGGQTLMPMLNMRLATPRRLIDLNRVPGLAYVATRDGGIAVGAMTRQRTLERSDAIAAHVPLLADALPWVGHGAIRNRGTLGGSLAHADPAGELPGVAACLDARLTVRGAARTRTVSAREFFTGYLSTALAPDELLTEVWFPTLPPGTGVAWLELARRHGDYALVGVAAAITLEGAVVREARLALIGVAGAPVRATGAEYALTRQRLTSDVLAAAADHVSRALDPPSDIHATGVYRRHVAAVLTTRAVQRAAERAAAR